MFANARIVVLAGMVGILLAGTLFAALIIDAISGAPQRDLTSPAAVAAATRSLPRYWVIRPGDTFDSIAARNHLSISQLQQLNRTQDPGALLAGQHLRLHLHTPKVNSPRRVLPAFWIVRRSETYTSIATKTGLQIADIAQFNPKVNPNALVPGQRLKLHP